MHIVPQGTVVWAIPRNVRIGEEMWVCPVGREKLQFRGYWVRFHTYMKHKWLHAVRNVIEDFPIDLAQAATWPKSDEGTDDGNTILFCPLESDEFAGFLVQQKDVRQS